MASLTWSFMPAHAQNTNEESFRKIQPMMDSSERDSVVKAVASMEQLASTGYIPALYEMCYTYGWYSDTVSLNRKKMLGIRYERDSYPKYLPLDNQVNTKAVEYLKQIIANAGPEYDDIKAQAYFRLAAYYVSDNRVLPTDVERARKYILSARKYALKGNNNKEFLERIESSLKNIADL